MSAAEDLQAIYGTNPYGARSWPMPFTTSSSVTSAKVKPGGYYLCPSQDCWVKLAAASGSVSVPSSGATQPASVNDTAFYPANQSLPLTVPSGSDGTGSFLHVIGDTAAGTLRISGPMQVQP